MDFIFNQKITFTIFKSKIGLDKLNVLILQAKTYSRNPELGSILKIAEVHGVTAEYVDFDGRFFFFLQVFGAFKCVVVILQNIFVERFNDIRLFFSELKGA